MRREGFTLIELLVVIGIIALLMALIMPALNAVRRQARAIVCQARIRQLAMDMQSYETDNHTLPHGMAPGLQPEPPGGYAGDARLDWPAWWWFNFTGTVQYNSPGQMELIECPSKDLGDPDLVNDVLCGNYGVNRSLCRSFDEFPPYGKEFGGRPLSTSNLRSPGATFLIVDSGYTVISWWHATDDPPVNLGSFIEDTAYIPGLKINGHKSLWSGQAGDAVGGRHPNKTINIGFADGHTERQQADTLLVEKEASEQYANRNPLWEPK